MKKKLFFTLAVIIYINAAFAQNSNIKGKVIDEKTGETLPGAVVVIQGTFKTLFPENIRWNVN
jgi:hypothetical protein